MIKEPEIWKDIIGYEGLYKISSYGRVESIPRDRTKGGILKPRLNKTNYLYIFLSKNNKKKNFRVNRLVAIHFVSNPENLPEVNHDDGNKLNNYYKNLIWCTGKQKFNSIHEAARTLNIDRKNISACCNGKRLSAGKHIITNENLTWKFVL